MRTNKEEQNGVRRPTHPQREQISPRHGLHTASPGTQAHRMVCQGSRQPLGHPVGVERHFKVDTDYIPNIHTATKECLFYEYMMENLHKFLERK